VENQIMISIIAAGSAVFGSLAAQLGGIVRLQFDRRKERSELLRTKLEELTDNLHKAPEWFELLINSLPVKGAPLGSASGDLQRIPLSVLGGAHQQLPLPDAARKVYVFSLLYFPLLRKEAKALLDSAYSFYILATSGQTPDEKKLQDASSKFGDAKEALDILIIAEAEKHHLI